MNVPVERGISFGYEFSPMELVVDTHDIYKRSLQIVELEAIQERSENEIARLEGLRRIKGYIGGYELAYRIEGFDFVRFGDCGDILLLTFLSPLLDEHKTPTELFAPGEVHSIFKYHLKEGKGVGGKFELKIHEFDDSGDEFVSEDRFYTLHPIVTPIWEPHKIERVEKALKESPERELIKTS